jgi:predicted kinase
LEAVIFVGIQGTGKSTFYKERYFRTHVRINLDMLRTRHREAVLLHACIEAQQRFVVDNTNPTVEQRARYILPARAAGFRVIGYYFQSALAAAIQRNESRPLPERIPAKAIAGTYKQLQIPTLTEAFDALHYVRLSEGGFSVEDWQDAI